LPGASDNKNSQPQKGKRSTKEGAMSALLFVPLVPFRGLSLRCSEVSLTSFVTAIAIKFDCVACAFARRAAVLSAFLGRTRARWVLAFLFVSHLLLSYDFLLEELSE